MMKCLYFMLFVAVSQAFVVKDNKETQRSIPAPRFEDLSFFSNPLLGITIEWDPVENTASNPVIGYRLIVLEETSVNSAQYRNYQDVGLYGATNTLAAVAKITRGLWYQFQVQAITTHGYGPLSLPWGFSLGQRDGQRKESYTLFKNDEGDKREYLL